MAVHADLIAPESTAPSRIEDLTRRELLASALAELLIACSDDYDPVEEPASTSRRLDDHWGEVEVPAAPTRIISGDTITLASLYALGVKPVGSALNRNVKPPFPDEWLAGIVDITGEANNSNDVEKALSQPRPRDSLRAANRRAAIRAVRPA